MATIEFRVYHGWKRIAEATDTHEDTIKKRWKEWGLKISFQTGKPMLTSAGLQDWYEKTSGKQGVIKKTPSPPLKRGGL